MPQITDNGSVNVLRTSSSLEKLNRDSTLEQSSNFKTSDAGKNLPVSSYLSQKKAQAVLQHKL